VPINRNPWKKKTGRIGRHAATYTTRSRLVLEVASELVGTEMWPSGPAR
jgi:hypothetical protein